MKTYLVIPDDDNGGLQFEMLCRALTAQEACERVSEQLGHLTAVFYPIDTTDNDEEAKGGDTWVVRELPYMLNDRGVVGWERFPVSVFTLGLHPDAANEGVEVEGCEATPGVHEAACGCHE